MHVERWPLIEGRQRGGGGFWQGASMSCEDDKQSSIASTLSRDFNRVWSCQIPDTKPKAPGRVNSASTLDNAHSLHILLQSSASWTSHGFIPCHSDSLTLLPLPLCQCHVRPIKQTSFPLDDKIPSILCSGINLLTGHCKYSLFGSDCLCLIYFFKQLREGVALKTS